MAANSIGAQIILDYNFDAALGARGGRGGTIEENTMARDADLIARSSIRTRLRGRRPGSHGTAAQVTATGHGPAATGKATRMSSLAGIVTMVTELRRRRVAGMAEQRQRHRSTQPCRTFSRRPTR